MCYFTKASCIEVRSNLIPTGEILVNVMHKHFENKSLFLGCVKFL